MNTIGYPLWVVPKSGRSTRPRLADEPPTVTSAIEGWVFSEPKSRPAWMKEFR